MHSFLISSHFILSFFLSSKIFYLFNLMEKCRCQHINTQTHTYIAYNNKQYLHENYKPQI